ncbi:hypothetical protein [Streptomyces sp. NPDC054783]
MVRSAKIPSAPSRTFQSKAGLDDTGLADFVFGEDPDGVDPELEEESGLQTAFNSFVQQYLQNLRDTV